MSDYVLIKTETLTELADEIRRISGQTDAMSPAEMIELLGYCVMGDIATSDALVNIDMSDGANLGTGGSAYDATNTNGFFSGKEWYCSGAGSLSIPSDFLCGTDPWTIVFTIKNYTTSSATYSRIAQGDSDVPSIYWSKANSQFQLKLAAATVTSTTTGITILDSEFMAHASATSAGFYYPTNFASTFAFRNNGECISFWVNGMEKARELSSNYLEAKYSEVFGIGDVLANKGYNMSYLKCSMLKAWNRALTDAEIIMVSCGR